MFFSKSSYFNYIPPEHKLKYFTIKSLKDLYQIHNYPVIFKPEICNTTGRGVSVINNYIEAQHYIKNTNDTIIVQEYANMKYEVTILYEKIPYHSHGKIINITFRENASWKFKPLSCQNSNCLEKQNWITDKLEKKINLIANKIPNLYAARLDIRFNNMNQFMQGKSFKILEINGVMGYDNSAFNLKNDKHKNVIQKIIN